ncbi:hypothetical protein MJN51_37245, partial [Salmonella enterica subsp. enterica serovar Kentucky]|nr:hypothetical protein [Salmonella enterica subsp. enterica serovar Kentucky]
NLLEITAPFWRICTQTVPFSRYRKHHMLPLAESDDEWQSPGKTTVTPSFTGSKLSLREIIPIRSFINFMLSGVTFTTET